MEPDAADVVYATTLPRPDTAKLTGPKNGIHFERVGKAMPNCGELGCRRRSRITRFLNAYEPVDFRSSAYQAVMGASAR